MRIRFVKQCRQFRKSSKKVLHYQKGQVLSGRYMDKIVNKLTSTCINRFNQNQLSQKLWWIQFNQSISRIFNAFGPKFQQENLKIILLMLHDIVIVEQLYQHSKNYMQSQEGIRRESMDVALIRDEPKLVIIVICLSTAFYGWTVVNLSAVPQAYLQTSYGNQINSPTIYGVLQGSVPAGAIVGAGIASSIMRILSRKKYVLLVNLLALIVEGVLQIPNIWVLLVCRILQGVFVGLYMAIVPIYISDLSPRQIVGSFGVYTNLFVVVAIVLCFTLQVIFQEAVGLAPQPFWRIIWLLPTLPIIVQSILLLTGFVPESPNSLLISGRRQQARKVLSMFHKRQYIEEAIQLREKEVQLETGVRNQDGDGIKISKWAYLVAFELPLMQQFVGVGSVSAQVGNIIGTYNHTLGLYLPLIVNAVQLVGNYSAVFLLRTMGRRTVALLGNGTVGLIDLVIAVLFLFISQGWGVVVGVTVALIFYMLAFGLTLGPITWLYVPEIIPASIVPLATMDNWIAATIVYTITPIVVDAAGPSTLFFIFTGLTAIFFVMNCLLMVETKDLSREVIAKRFFRSEDD